MSAFAVRSSYVRSTDRLREGSAATPDPIVAAEPHVMPLYVIVEEGRTQANVGKPEEDD